MRLSESFAPPGGSPQRHPLRSATGTLVLVAILALLANFTYFWFFPDFLAPDSARYMDSAANMAAGHGFTNSTGYPETVVTPGYPLLLAFFFRLGLGVRDVVVAQHLLNLLIAVATAAFAFALTGSRAQALIAGILLSLDLPTLASGNTILTEVLFTAVLALIVWLLWAECGESQRHWLTCCAVGFLSGAAVLIRPVGLFFLLPAVAYLLLVRQHFRWRAALGFVLAFASLPLIWAGRNYQQIGYFTVTSLAGTQTLSYRAAGVLAIEDPGDFYANSERRRAELEHQACEELKRNEGKRCEDLSIPQKSEYYGRLGRKIILQHPVSYVKLALRASAAILLGGDAIHLASILGTTSAVASRMILMYTIPLFCFACLGWIRWWRDDRKLFYLVVLVVGYFVGISAGAEAYSRFRVPIMPLYAMSIAAGVESTVKRFHR